MKLTEAYSFQLKIFYFHKKIDELGIPIRKENEFSECGNVNGYFANAILNQTFKSLIWLGRLRESVKKWSF